MSFHIFSNTPFIARRESIDKDNENMPKSVKDLKEYFSNAGLSMVDEHDYQSNLNKYHEFKEGLGKHPIYHAFI